MRKYILDLVLLVAVVALIAQFGGVVRETLLYLVFGWWWYAERVIPKVTVSRDGLSMGIVCLVLFAIGFHALLRGFYREIQQPGERPDTGARRWSSRWTTSIIAIVLLMFVIGLAASALVHQAGWLMRSPEPLMVSKPVVLGSSLWNLRLIGDAALGFETLPAVRADSQEPGYRARLAPTPKETLPAARVDSQGRLLHSWQTEILSGLWMPFYGQFDPARPWNDPVNSAYFRGIVPVYLNPEIGVIRSPEGYALSHYAGNVNVLGRAKPLALKEIEGSLAQTVLAGEVSVKFKPWGDPTNLRDPILGINTMPDAFGSTSPGGAHFLFLDGSVRFVRETADPAVLRAMSRTSPPAGH